MKTWVSRTGVFFDVTATQHGTNFLYHAQLGLHCEASLQKQLVLLHVMLW